MTTVSPVDVVLSAGGVGSPSAIAGAAGGASGGPGVGAEGLRLLRLEMVGFKSFADKTTFTFDEPITGVVGPNGCGKSNLVDAVKWVLGERSSKSLRGKEMIDVIFAGSAGRKPGGMASVTLVFSNPERDGDGGRDGETERRRDEVGESHGATEPRSHGGEGSDEGDVVAEFEDSVDAVEHVAEGEDEIETVLSDRWRVRRPLPIDAEEVSVTRELYRDGTSKYLINGKRARLKDIRDLFLDTGIGADAYSIIEQGKVDAMLLASPQERRTIFEEAAGVAKYKVRRVEAKRKLDRTEANLVRTREQLESTERRLKTVRTQAAKARRFQELDDEAGALRLAIAFQQYDEVRLSLESLTSSLQKLGVERDETQRAVAALESDKREADALRAEIEAELRRAEQARQSAEHGRQQAEQRAAMAARSIEEAERAIETETKRRDEAQATSEAVAQDAADARDELASLAEKLGDAERSLETLNKERSGAIERAGVARRALAEARQTLEKIERDRARVSAEAEARGRERAQVEARAAKLRERAAALDGVIAKLRETIDATRASLAEAEARIRDRSDATERLGEQLSALAEDRSGRVEALSALERELAGADARRGTLDELVKTRAGLGEAARAALEMRDRGEGFAGVVAPLAELIETDAEHASVVEAGLGDLLDALVVRTPSEMPTREELDRLPGRVRVAVLTDAGEWEPGIGAGEAAVLAVRVGRVREMVRVRGADDVRSRVEGLLDRVLGNCLSVGTLDAAQMLRASGLSSARFVTREGDVVEPDGTMTVGPAAQGAESGVLARAAELADLEVKVEALRGRVERERAELARTDERLGAVQAERGEVERALAQARGDAGRAQSSLDREGAELARAERDLGSASEEAGELDAQGAGIAGQIEELAERERKLAGLAGERREAVTTLEASVKGAEGEAEAAADALSRARVEVGRLGEQAGASRREVRRLETEVENTKRRVGEHERHIEEARERRERHVGTVTSAEEERTRLRGEVEALGEAARALGERVREVAGRVESVGADLGKARERARLVERDWNGLEGSRREQEVRREHLEERALEDAGVDLAKEYLDYRAVVAPGDVSPVDIPDAQARLNVLRDEIKKLGNVNLDAIAEEDVLAEKNDELVAQLTDIDEARMRLAELITRLDEASKARFGEVFGRIQANFGGQDGMFRKLFGGGRAEVRLMPLVKEVDGQKVQTDEVDLLESGIEVIAKPPGKEPRSISQLSGGEKTLTAVALLMSIFRSKPSCFCILDEVDAALDESNVARFGNVVREFTSFSRFIVITHNKRTMQICDHMYGVTQRERGVSSRVSVRFDQVGKDGTVSADAVKGAETQEKMFEEPTPTPEADRPSGALRKALGRMREGKGPVEVEAGTPVEAENG